MYCESNVSHVDYGDVEHIKPKGAGRYPELEFEWGNLGYACRKCNVAKGDKYHESTPYLDPYSELPEGHVFAAGAWLFARNGSERGDLTIADVQLNRPSLLEKRQARIQEMVKELTACFRTTNAVLREKALKALALEAVADKEYSLAVEALLNNSGVSTGTSSS
jgi:hypothetical protein